MKATGDLAELSDLFRRHAQFDNERRVELLVKQTRELACLMSNYMFEYGDDLGYNRDVVRKLAKKVNEIDCSAKALGLSVVTLPFDEDSPYAELIADQVLSRQTHYQTVIAFQDEEYSRDLGKLGPIDKNVKTVLDEGIRGMLYINDELKYKWNRQYGI